MPRWFISRPIDSCNESELVAYRALNKLDDSWAVRWTYDYLSKDTPREGDFLILGPDGRLLVLEVKKRERVFARSGRSDGTDGNVSRDEDQVQSQKDGVLQALNAALDVKSDGFELPFIVPAIFSETGNSLDMRSREQPFSVIRGEAQLSRIAGHWNDLTAGGKNARDPAAVRRLFFKVYGDASPEAEAKFLSATDRLILDRMTADLSLLDALSGNRQILVRGGPGSGKTWLAERLARQFADNGKHVLFLCYNKALGAGFRRDMPRMPSKNPEAGIVDVHTWESLAESLTKTLPEGSIPAKHDGKEDVYYEETLPNAMLEAVTQGSFASRYDALVVDEAQDHNTEWWEIYFSLLRAGAGSRMGIFYDPAQRPSFRAGAFAIGGVAQPLSQAAHFRLLRTRRYTRPVFDFLRSLASDETAALVDGLHPGALLIGPEVILQEHPSLDAAKSAAAAMLKKWFADKLAEPADTLLLTRTNPFGGKSPIFTNCETFAGLTLVAADAPHALDKGNLRVASFHKSKGLDARAVILLDTWPWNDLPPGQREGFWTAASRARQLLGVIATKK